MVTEVYIGDDIERFDRGPAKHACSLRRLNIVIVSGEEPEHDRLKLHVVGSAIWYSYRTVLRAG